MCYAHAALRCVVAVSWLILGGSLTAATAQPVVGPPDPGELRRAPEVVATIDGGFVVVWFSHTSAGRPLAIRAQRVTSDGAAEGSVVDLVELNDDDLVLTTSLALNASPGGGFVLAWRDDDPDACYRVRSFSATGAMEQDFEPLACDGGEVTSTSLAFAESGVLGLAYLHQIDDGMTIETALRLRRYGASGEPIGEDETIIAHGDAFVQDPLVAAMGSYGFAVAWREDTAQDPFVHVQRLSELGGAYGPRFSHPGIRAALDALSDGTVLLAYLAMEPTGAPFVPKDLTLTRLRVDGTERSTIVNAMTPDATPLIAATGRGGSLVVWLDGGLQAQFQNENGAPMAPAFPVHIGGRLPAAAVSAQGRAVVVSVGGPVLAPFVEGTTFLALQGCEPSATTACLNGSRFSVTTEWFDAENAPRPGVVVGRSLSDETTGFSFFGTENWEILVKVLNGCAINGHYWVLAGAATDVGYDIAVRRGEDVWMHTNPVGVLSDAIADVGAFPCEE